MTEIRHHEEFDLNEVTRVLSTPALTALMETVDRLRHDEEVPTTRQGEFAVTPIADALLLYRVGPGWVELVRVVAL